MATMREEKQDKIYPMLEDIANITCDHIEKLLLDITNNHTEELEMDEDNISVDDVISVLNRLKLIRPEQEIIVETPNGSVNFRIGDALIYEGMSGEIVIDSE